MKGINDRQWLAFSVNFIKCTPDATGVSVLGQWPVWQSDEGTSEWLV